MERQANQRDSTQNQLFRVESAQIEEKSTVESPRNDGEAVVNDGEAMVSSTMHAFISTTEIFCINSLHSIVHTKPIFSF